MVEVGLAGKERNDFARRVYRLRTPSAVFPVDQFAGDETPNAPVPLLILESAVDLVEEGGGGYSLSRQPPQPVPKMGISVPVECVAEAAFCRIPAGRASAAKQRFRSFGEPAEPPATELPELQDESRPLERMARGDTKRPENVVAGIVAVHAPLRVVMLWDLPAGGGRSLRDYKSGYRLSPVEIHPIASRFVASHGRLGEMHVRVLAAVIAYGRPVEIELLGRGAVLRFPKMRLQNLRDFGKQPIGIRVADKPRARGGEENEGMAVGLLATVPAVTDAPDVAAVLHVAMAVPQKRHAMIDKAVRTGAAHQTGNCEAMDHAGGNVDLADLRFADRTAGIVEGKEATRQIEALSLENFRTGRSPDRLANGGDRGASTTSRPA